MSGAASAIAPFVGGWLLADGGWRWVFLINPPIALLVVAVAVRHVPETTSTAVQGRIDVAGSILGATALGGLSAGLIAASGHSIGDVRVLAPLLTGVGAGAAFVCVERRSAHPMLPTALFRIREFSAANAVTFLLYAAIGGALMLLVIELQTVAGMTPLAAGAALLPITGIMLVLAAPFVALAARTGPRLPMTAGPFVSASGLAMLTKLSPDSHYVSAVLPAMIVFGLGLSVFVAPLTATALGAVPAEHASTASGVNNAVARSAGLIAVAALPAIVGISGDVYADAAGFLPGFRAAIWICVVLQAGGGLLAATTIGNGAPRASGSCGLSLAGQPVASALSARPPRHT